MVEGMRLAVVTLWKMVQDTLSEEYHQQPPSPPPSGPSTDPFAVKVDRSVHRADGPSPCKWTSIGGPLAAAKHHVSRLLDAAASTSQGYRS